MINVSNEFLSKIKEPSRTIKGSVGIGDLEISNFIAGGDTEIGVGYAWTLSVDISSFIAGHKYYVSSIVRTDSLIRAPRIAIGFTETVFNLEGESSNVPHRISALLECATVKASSLIYYLLAATDGVTQAFFSNRIIIDVTESYGIGNEPSKEYMDELIAKVGWFDGITNVPLQFSEDRKLDNIITNGNFIDTSSWELGQCTTTASNNVLSMTGTGGMAYQYITNSTAYGAIDDIIYTTLKVNLTDSLVAKFMLYANGGANGYVFENVNSPVYAESPFILSGTLKLSVEVMDKINFIAYYANETDCTGSVVEVSNCISLNLTSIYGKGNEPSVEYMDSLITQTGWFENKRLTLDETSESTNIIDYTIESSFGSNNIPTIGGVVANKLILQLTNDSRMPEVLIDTPIRPYVSIDIDGLGNYEWVKLGEFYAEYSDVVKSKLTIKIDSFDIMTRYDGYRYDTSLTFPATIQDMINEINTTYNITFAIQTLPSMSFSFAPTGTVRQIIAMIASLITTNATINSIGEVEFRFKNDSGFTMNADNYIDFKLTSDSIINISEIIIPTEESEVSIVSGNTSGFALAFENDAILDSAALAVVYAREFPYSFYAYDMKAQGMPHLEVGDTIEFTDVENVIRTLHIVNHSFSFNGGMSSTFKVDAPKSPTTETTVTGGSTIAKAIARSYGNVAIAIQNATGLITGNQGGNIITILDDNGRPTELVICDTGDINTATNVWRWNLSGLGFSSTGINGPFNTAITMDGHIIAEFLTALVITGEQITGGTITGALLKTSDTTSYVTVDNQNVNLHVDGKAQMKIGIDETWEYDKYPYIAFGPDCESVLNMKNYIWYAQGSVAGQVGGKLTMRGAEALTFISGKQLTINAAQEIYINAPIVNISSNIKLPNSTIYEDVTYLHLATTLEQIRVGNIIKVAPSTGFLPETNNTCKCGWSINNAWSEVNSFAFVNASDRNLKENIIEMDSSSSYDSIKNMKTYSYNYKSDKDEEKGKRAMIGVIADELPIEVLEQEEFGGINLYSLLTLNISALKEAMTRIDTLELEVQRLGGNI